MKLKQTLKMMVFSVALATGLVVVSGSLTPVNAAPCEGTADAIEQKIENGQCNADGTAITTPSTTEESFACSGDTDNTECCGGVKTSVISCTQNGGSSAIKDSGIWGILLIAINILTAGIGIAAVGGVVYASILYSSSAGEPEKTKKAMTIISDIVIGVVAYALMYAALNFLVPGGLFNTPSP